MSDDMFYCSFCDALFSTEEACIEHCESTHIEIKQEHDYDEYVVEETHEEDLEGPTEIIYEEIIEEPEPPKPKTRIKKERKPKSHYNAKNIVCEVCGKRYASNAALRYHQRVHTGERPYKCTQCSKSFTMPLFLQIHTRTHTGERPYECPLCPKAFSNKAALLRHDRVHTGIKPYECQECGKFFTQSNSLKLHINTVHLKMPAPYKSKSRRNKAKEREMLRAAILRVMDNEDNTAVQTISEPNEIPIQQDEHYITPEVYTIKPEQIEESEILYEDVDSREITYEVVYEQ
ncbi:zinc finger protein 271-like isoform X2 [Spodoptera litura]|uniref:Zinc finger protein 271-like isoform X2 n=1 Tax=Spodoptera litura TaxID=69820 RepID=A0A9J7ES83_SPOLT|nr:zinc finger protein 271-like isoform X2 [Spodoptera litura]